MLRTMSSDFSFGYESVVAVWWTIAMRSGSAYSGGFFRSDSSAPHCARVMMPGCVGEAAAAVIGADGSGPGSTSSTSAPDGRPPTNRVWTNLLVSAHTGRVDRRPTPSVAG